MIWTISSFADIITVIFTIIAGRDGMHDNDRCGLRGRFVKNKDQIVFRVESCIVELGDFEKGRVWKLPVEYKTGDDVDLQIIIDDHRGIICWCGHAPLEGEIERHGTALFLVEDDGELILPVDNLVGFDVEIKAEVYDLRGATERLAEIKRKLS